MRSFADFRHDFPILAGKNRGKPLVYLDSASSSQKPQPVIDAISHYYSHDNANIHRGIYELSERASRAYENTRIQVKNFIHASSSEEIIFVSGTTEAVNLVASSYGQRLQAGDEIILSVMEHHSNIVPWQLLRDRVDVVLKIIPMHDNGELDREAYQHLFTAKTRMVSIIHVSNVLGTINPIQEMIAYQHHQQNVPVFVDGAQAVSHFSLDMQALDCDFYAFSSHKMYGPTGVGILYAKKQWLDSMPPYQGGGDMIETVAFEKTTYAKLPNKFEAGTPPISSVMGLSAAITYLEKIGIDRIGQHEHTLLQQAEARLIDIPGLQILGRAKAKSAVISFIIENIHPHDIGTILDHEGVAVRAGHHCAMPLMTRLAVPATVRVSMGLYNTIDDIDALVEAIYLAKKIFG